MITTIQRNVGLILLWINLEVSTFTQEEIEAMKKNESLELVAVPNSTDTQILAEALYLNLPDKVPRVNDFPSKTQTAVDVCELPIKGAMEYCLKLDKMYERVDGYSLIPDGEIEECKPYQVAFFHCSGFPSRDTVRARKCPFQPNELFVTTGNVRVPAFALTWVNADKKYLHVDHYIDLHDKD